MIGSFRNFAKTKFAGILVFIMIIPFVFWGMGGMFSSGNTNIAPSLLFEKFFNLFNIIYDNLLIYKNKSID